jgi:hypothetical protein
VSQRKIFTHGRTPPHQAQTRTRKLQPLSLERLFSSPIITLPPDTRHCSRARLCSRRLIILWSGSYSCVILDLCRSTRNPRLGWCRCLIHALVCAVVSVRVVGVYCRRAGRAGSCCCGVGWVRSCACCHRAIQVGRRACHHRAIMVRCHAGYHGASRARRRGSGRGLGFRIRMRNHRLRRIQILRSAGRRIGGMLGRCLGVGVSVVRGSRRDLRRSHRIWLERDCCLCCGAGCVNCRRTGRLSGCPCWWACGISACAGVCDCCCFCNRSADSAAV